MTKRFLICGLACFMAMTATAAEQRVPLSGHRPPQVKSAAVIARTPSTESVPLSLMVRVDPVLMDQALNQLYGPNASPAKRFLTSEEFAAQFGLAEKRRVLKNFARANGLAIAAAGDRPESMIVNVSGSAGQVERVFGVQLQQYRATNNEIFRAPAAEPLIPVSLKPHLSGVVGLSNARFPIQPRSRLVSQSAIGPHALTGVTGPVGGLSPADIKTVYGLNGVTLDGTNQTVALFQVYGFDPADITAYENQFGLPNRPVTYISVDGFANLCDGVVCGPDPTPSNFRAEVVLDVQMVKALAPNAQILNYTGPPTFQGSLNIFDAIATANVAQTVSTSWGGDEISLTFEYMQLEYPIFQRMALQGQSMFASSGDGGAFGRLGAGDATTIAVGDPDSQPYVTAVGGTTLNGTLSSYTETTWYLPPYGSGGGISAFWPIPNYQVGIPGLFSKQSRNVPDVCLNADVNSGYSVYVAGNWYRTGGTSAAAPLWAAFAALINQQRGAQGKGRWGFANPTLYQLAATEAYHTLFNDITSGTNGYYSAGAGYDNTTGLGSFKGSSLLTAVVNTLDLSAASGLTNVYAYPNPWDTRRNSVRRMTFANLPDGATVKIFTISGFLVKTLTAANARAIWDLTNESGDAVASGLYLYLADHGGQHVRGKVAIIK